MRRRLFLALVVVGASLSSAFAQCPVEYKRLFFSCVDNRGLVEKNLNKIGLTKMEVGRSFALVAGVTKYPNFKELQDRDLTPAEVDIEKLKHYLREQEFFDEIVVLKDGDMTLNNLNYFLETYFPERLKSSPHSRFLFAYSGHGYATGSGETVQGFLLTSAAATMTDPVNRVPMSLVRTMMDPIVDAAQQVLVLVNACESGAFLGRRAFGPTAYDPSGKGAHAIMASAADQNSLHVPEIGPGSVFFEKVFAGLAGAADTSPDYGNGRRGDGIVTFHELFSYLYGEVRLATHGTQTPRDGDISLNGSVGEFYFLNRSRQVAAGNVPAWDPRAATPFGLDLGDKAFTEAKIAYGAKRYSDALPLFRQAAAAGNGDAMDFLGYMYKLGFGVGQDYQQARQWFEKGAAAGSGSAMFDLGILYDLGSGVTRDYQQARQWYEKGAAAGNTGAMAGLGMLYKYGQGVAQDYQQERQWFEKSAAAGNEMAMYYLGYMYEHGEGVAKNNQTARQWYEKGAAAGDNDAKAALDRLLK
jgi:TPR repeat protein